LGADAKSARHIDSPAMEAEAKLARSAQVQRTIASRQAWSADESAANQITAHRVTAGRVIRIKALTVLLDRGGRELFALRCDDEVTTKGKQ
jgi:hypothetical protein